MVVAGIDVGSKNLVVAIDKAGRPETFDNSPQDHRQVVKALRGAKVDRVILEATGTYHLDLAITLDEAGLAVRVVNPNRLLKKPFPELFQPRKRKTPFPVPSQFSMAYNHWKWRHVRVPQTGSQGLTGNRSTSCRSGSEIIEQR